MVSYRLAYVAAGPRTPLNHTEGLERLRRRQGTVHRSPEKLVA